MAINLNDNLIVQAPKATDERYGPYASEAEALTAIEPIVRYRGLTAGVYIAGQLTEYWFRDGTLDTDFVEKTAAGPDTRINTSYTTEVLAQNEVAEFTMNLGKLSDLVAIQVSEASWVRVYRSSAQRSADTRASPGGPLQAVINLGDNKPYSENVTTLSSETIIQNPVPLLQGDANGLVYIRLVKRSTGSSAVTLITTTYPQED